MEAHQELCVLAASKPAATADDMSVESEASAATADADKQAILDTARMICPAGKTQALEAMLEGGATATQLRDQAVEWLTEAKAAEGAIRRP